MRRPEALARFPETNAVQSAPLSSRQRASSPRRTMSPTAGGCAAGCMGGSNALPAFGGGLRPAYGPRGSLTAFGGSLLFAVVSTLLGWLADQIGVRWALLVSTTLCIIPLLFYWLAFRQDKEDASQEPAQIMPEQAAQ